MTTAEQMLVGAGTELSAALRRSKRRLGDGERYEELVDWAAHLAVSRGLSHNTGANYLDAVTGFLLWLREQAIELEAVTPSDIERWQQQLFLRNRERGQTRHVKLVGVRRWFAWREQFGRGRNPSRSIQGPKREHRMARKYTRGQLRAMFATCNRDTPQGLRDYTVLLLILATGARRMEVADLTLSQLALSQRAGHVRFFGKGAKERVVPFGPLLVQALTEWLAARDNLALLDQEAVFVGFRGNGNGRRLQRTGLDGIVVRAIKRARIAVEPGMALHTLRATYATTLYDNKHDLEQIRILMGHEDINTTRKYIAISERQLKTKIPNDVLLDVTGAGRPNGGLPLHAQLELRRRGHGLPDPD